MKETKITCEKCRFYCRLVDYQGHTVGHCCELWLDGMSDGGTWEAKERCFEPRPKRQKSIYTTLIKEVNKIKK